MLNKILVTGGAGYIGSHTVVELQQAGFEITIIDNLSNSYIEIIDRIEQVSKIKPHFFKVDVADNESLNAFFSENNKFVAVIHFAAFKAVGESTEKPLSYYHNNIVSLLNLLRAMEQYQIKNFVFSSSCTVYGQPDVLPVTEQTPTKTPESPYGNTKKIAEEILADVAKTTNLNVVSLRYFNPVGADASALLGELPSGIPNNLVPYVTQSAAGIRGPVTVFGNDYNTPDGSCIRDYIHVVDLAKAHVIAVQRLIEEKHRKSFEVFNLGTGKGYSVIEVLETFKTATGKSLNYKIGQRRPGDVEKIYADTTLANKELGWQAKLDLTEMMRSAWEWQQNIPDFVKK